MDAHELTIIITYSLAAWLAFTIPATIITWRVLR